VSALVEVGGFAMPVLETMMDWALFWAGQGIPVFPLHEVYDGVCTCACTRKKCSDDKHGCGASCANKGKHPRWHREDLPHGLENATTNLSQIRRWWMRWPTANVGGAMGREMQLIALDFDPRHGGDLSLNDLLEAHGGGWLQTLTFKTGSGGFHFVFQYPADQVLRNSAGEVGPGVDTRGEGGYIVLPPSIHASGNLYEMYRVTAVIPAPDWLLEVFRPKREPARLINFQANTHSHANAFSGTARRFGVGERNDGLRNVCLGRWVNGWAETPEELFRQLVEVRDTRCSFAPGDPPPDDEFLRDLVERTVRKYARGVRREGAA
jgi:putative DNA primase/helicase